MTDLASVLLLSVQLLRYRLLFIDSRLLCYLFYCLIPYSSNSYVLSYIELSDLASFNTVRHSTDSCWHYFVFLLTLSG